MSDVIAAALIFLIGIPLVLAVYFGFAFIRQARRAARLKGYKPSPRASRKAPPR